MFQIPKAGNARLPSRLPLANRIDFNPKNLFANDEPGTWFEANDASTLFTDVAGTTPVTAPGDAVALQLDKSQGLALGPELVTNGDFSDGSTGWTGTAHIFGTFADGTFSVTGLNTILSQDGILVSGRTYKIIIEVISHTSGTLFLPGGSTVTTAGTIERLFVASGTDLDFSFTATPEMTIDNVSVRELPGNHRTQATTAARPLYALHPVGGVRNKLEYTEEFDNAVWAKLGTTITANAGVAPNGTTTADRVVYSAADSDLSQTLSTTSAAYTGSVYVKGTIGETIRVSVLGGTVTDHTLSGDWDRVTSTTPATTAPRVSISTFGGVTARDIFIWGAQLEQGSTATNYQRVGSFLDVSEEGKARRGRLWYNGTSHFMETGTITPGTDKVQVFAGIRKLSDASTGLIVEFSPDSGSAVGSFYVAAPDQAGSVPYSSLSRGTSAATAANRATISVGAAPDTAVLTATHDIAGDLSRIRRNGVFGVDGTGDKGTGNFLAYPLYFGARGGTSLFFNGYEDTSIVRFGPNLDATTISKVESYVASKTPEPTL